ncbi:MAG TPA: hypothetical protein VE442_25800 [Jatrophihabitans sp.]|nr:hypothetical protein [Jatrophihabitans sp.]
MKHSRLLVLGLAALTTAGLAVALPASTSAAPAPISGTTRVVPGGQHTTLSGAGNGELAPAVGPEAGTVREPVANRSLSSNAKVTRSGPGLSGISAPSSAIAGNGATSSFNGIDHITQRFGVAGGNQWSIEPPDQALCVGNGFVFEAINNAVAVYDTSGNRLALDSLNHFFGYDFEINRTTGVQGPQTTDPTCLFDPATGRFFLTILTYFVDAAGNPTGVNTLDTAVSATGNPVGAWTISHIDATDDGSNGTPSHPNCPCLGDYPHIGVDATGYYITTNEYPWFVDGFNGAQIYAMSKAQLAAGATALTVTQFDTTRGAPNRQPGFTIWPAQSPTISDYSHAAGGTEYFLSTNAAEEANGTGTSDTLLTWSLTNTSSLASAPALALRVVGSTVGTYGVPIATNQKVGPTPLADCLNVTACAKATLGTPDKFKETERPLDSLDSRMQQVTYAGGHLYGSHGTALDPAGDTQQRAGVAWYVTTPHTATNGNLSTTVAAQGRIAAAGQNLIMPALGVRPNGTAVIGMTLAGTDYYPSPVYVDLVGGATGPVHVVTAGLGPEDGFAGYRGFVPARPRWGDYGAAAVDAGGRLWVANEWIGQTCTFQTYVSTNFTCGNTRTALANWYTRITLVG